MMAVRLADGSDGAETVLDDLQEAASWRGAVGPGQPAGMEAGAGRGEGSVAARGVTGATASGSWGCPAGPGSVMGRPQQQRVPGGTGGKASSGDP